MSFSQNLGLDVGGVLIGVQEIERDIRTLVSLTEA